MRAVAGLLAICVAGLCAPMVKGQQRGSPAATLQTDAIWMQLISQPLTSQVVTVGELASLHVVSISSHPSDAAKLLYADETAVYELDKATGESSRIAGRDTVGLIMDRVSADGAGSDASFTFITKIVCRKGGLYIFDYDRLRVLNLADRMVRTVSVLSTAVNDPITGDVSRDEQEIFWTNTASHGYFVMKVAMSRPLVEESELLVAGPTMAAYLELSYDGSHLFISDVDRRKIERVSVSTGEYYDMDDGDDEAFYPGALASTRESHLIAVDRGTKSIYRYDANAASPRMMPLCDRSCNLQISNPFDVASDDMTGDLYVLDTQHHPSLQTYRYFIRRVTASSSALARTNGSRLGSCLQFVKWGLPCRRF